VDPRTIGTQTAKGTRCRRRHQRHQGQCCSAVGPGQPPATAPAKPATPVAGKTMSAQSTAPRPPIRRPLLSRVAALLQPDRPPPQSCAAALLQANRPPPQSRAAASQRPEAPSPAGPSATPQRLAGQSRAASNPARPPPRRKAEPGGTGKPALKHTGGNPPAVRERTARASKEKRRSELNSSPTMSTGRVSLIPLMRSSTLSRMASR
jgi:hypothetical protein